MIKLAPLVRVALIAQTLWLSSNIAVYAIDAPVQSSAQVDPASPKTIASDPAHRLASQVIAALGGMDKVKSVIDAATLSKGQMTDYSAMSGASNTVKIELLSQGEKFKIDLFVLGQKAITGYNGKVAWQQHGAEIFPSDPITTKKIAEDSSHGTLLYLRLEDSSVPMKLLPEKEVQGKKCAGMEVEAADGKPTSLYIDPDTHMVLGIEYMGTDFEQGSEAYKRVELSDYRPVMGSFLPFKSTEYTGGKKTSEETLASVDVKDEIDQTVFDMPARKAIEGLGKEAIILPFEYLSNEIVIKAKVNDKTELKFLLDTGATQNVMETSAATTFGTVAKSDMALTTGSGFVTMGGMVLQSIQLGDIKLIDVPMAVADMPGFAQIRGGHPVGILGANVLRRFAITVDYEQRKVYLRDPAQLVVPEGATVVQAEPALGAGGLCVNAVADGKLKLRLLVDTGAAFNSISMPLIKPIIDFPLLPVGSVEGVDGYKVAVGSVQLNSLSLDRMSLNDPIFSVAPGAAESKMPVGLLSASALGILGNTYWSHFRLTVDYVNGRIILEQSATAKAAQEITLALRQASIKYHKDHDAEAAINNLNKLLVRAQGSELAKSRALVAVAKAQISCEKNFATQKNDQSQAAASAFELALVAARESGDAQLEAKVLCDEAICLMDHEPGYTETRAIQRLLQSASALSQSEPDLLVAAAVFFGKNGVITARKMIDQALVQEPANWRALVEKSVIAKRESKSEEEQQALALLQHYYPGSTITSPAQASSARSANKAAVKTPASDTPATRSSQSKPASRK